MPSNLQMSGIQLVVQGISQYLSALQAVNTANAAMGASTANSVSQVNNLNSVMARAVSSQQKYASAVATANDKLQRAIIDQGRAEIAYNKAQTSGTPTQKLAATQKVEDAIYRTEAAYSRLQATQNAEAQSAIKNANAVANAQQQVANTVMNMTTRVAGASIGGGSGGGGIGSAISSIIGGIKGGAGGVFSTVLGIIGSLPNPIAAATSAVSGFMSSIGNVAGGFLFRDMIRGVTGELNNMSASIGQAAANLQQLQVRFDNMISRQLRATDSTLTYDQSIKDSTKYTKELLAWMTKLAATTPFSIDTIANTVSLGMAMDFGVQGTMDLTKATLDFVAGAGLSNDVIERIIFNFAQMKNAGKVTATELRDLARGAMLPILDILQRMADNKGIKVTDMKKFRQEVSEGKVSVDEFFKAYEQFVQEAFPNAAEKMGATITGLKYKLENFFKIMLGWNVFGPVMAKAASAISRAMDVLFSDKMQYNTKFLGVALSNTFDTIVTSGGQVVESLKQVWAALGLGGITINQIIGGIAMLNVGFEQLAMAITNAVDGLILPAIRSMTGKMGNTFSNTANNALRWGFNIVMQLAKGMIEGASSAIQQAMRYINGLLAGWLQPHSPPKVAPDIDKWGMETMAQWLHGFTMADFGALESIQGLLKSALDAIGSTMEKDGDKWAQTLWKEMNAALIGDVGQFAAGNGLGSEIFGKLGAMGPVFEREFTTLINLEAALATATNNAAAAQERLNAAQEAVHTITGELNKQVREYNAMLRSGVDRAQLNSKLKVVNANEISLDLAVKEQVQAQKAKEAADKVQEAAQKQATLQEKLIEQLIEIVKMQAEIKKNNSGGDTTTEQGGDLSGLGLPTPDQVDVNLQKLFNLMKIRLRMELAQIKAELDDWYTLKIKPIWDDIALQWDMFWTRVHTIWAVWSLRFQRGWQEFWIPFSTGFSENYDKVRGWTTTFVEWFQGKWATGTKNAKAAWDIFWSGVKDTQDTFRKWLQENTPQILKEAYQLGTDIVARIAKAITNAGSAIGSALLSIVKAAVQNALGALLDIGAGSSGSGGGDKPRDNTGGSGGGHGSGSSGGGGSSGNTGASSTGHTGAARASGSSVVGAGRVAAQPVISNTSVSFGNTIINGDLDAAVFQQRVVSAVLNAIHS